MASEKGAAEESEPEPGPSGSGSAPSYDPRVYQPPHPDDRGDGTPTKKGGGAKGKGKAKGKGGKATHRCANCDAPGAKRKCKGCGVVSYCGKECQAVRAAAWWW